MHPHLIALLLLVGNAGATFAAEPVASEGETLFSLSLKVEQAEDGKALNMHVQETSRTPEFSIVEVRVESGDSKTSMLYLARGLCGVMQARGKKLAVGEQISEHPVQFQLSFPGTAKVEDAKGLPRMFLSEQNCNLVLARKIQ